MNLVTDDERARIIERVKAGDSCTGIARDFNRSRSTVSRVAKAAGLVFDRAQTRAATEARKIDNAARRTRFAETVLEHALRMAENLPDQPLPVTSAKDAKDTAVALKVLLQASIEAEAANGGRDADASAVDQFLAYLIPATPGATR